MVCDSPALSVDTRIGASDGGGVRTTRNRIRPGRLLSAATRKVPVRPGGVADEALTSTRPSSEVTAVSPGSETSSKSAAQESWATCAGTAVQTWHRAPTSIRTDSACGTSMGSSGQRRIGRVSPTCTVTDKIALTPSGSSTEVPVVTSKTTAPGPEYEAAAETRKPPSAVTTRRAW